MMMDLKNLSTEQMKAEFLEIKIAELKKIDFEKHLNKKNSAIKTSSLVHLVFFKRN